MITIIIPTKNRPQRMMECLNAIADQECLDLLSEIVIVDDHSIFRYEDEVRQWEDRKNIRIIYLSNLKECGAAAARNEAARHATGEILAFLDDDALPQPNWLATIDKSMAKVNVSAITGRIAPIDNSIVSNARQLRYDIRQRRALEKKEPVKFFAGGNAAVRRSDFISLGGFKTEYIMMHDREFALRLAAARKSCWYIHELSIRHDHDKGVLAAVRNAFNSAYYSLRFRFEYPQISTGPVYSVCQSLSVVFREALSQHHLQRCIASVSFVVAIELVHCFGYFYYWLYDSAFRLVPGHAREAAKS